MNSSDIALFFFLNLLATGILYFMFEDGGYSDKKLRYFLGTCWALFTVAIEYQTSETTFPLFTIIFGFGYLMAYFALKEKA